MSKTETAPPDRLRAAGATDLERRLLDAAGRERPSRQLSERMAQAIGVSMAAAGNAADGGPRPDTVAPNAAGAAGSLVPWIAGALVVAAVAGGFVATRPSATPSGSPAFPAPALSVSDAPSALAAPMPPPVAAMASADTPSKGGEETSPIAPPPPASQRGRSGTTANDLADQIALVDAARAALAGGRAERALGIVRDYQAQYPTGTFRPEVAAVKIEALVKMGRTAEARALAERFVTAHGPSPLAERVARLAGLPPP